MPRPKRTIEQEWYDVFSDADVSEQAIMIRMCEQIHRQKRRGKLEAKPEGVKMEVTA